MVSLMALLTVLWVAVILAYARNLNEIIVYANKNKLDIFGRSYQSLVALIADVSFLNNLFSGKKILTHNDVYLIKKLQDVRWMLWIGVIIGIVIQAMMIVS
jgi:hypothetical protein